MRIDAWQVKVLLTFDRLAAVSQPISGGGCSAAVLQCCSPLEDLSFAVSIAIANSPMVSHGDVW